MKTFIAKNAIVPAVAIAGLALMATGTSAAVVQANNSDASSRYAYTVSAVDLINQGMSTLGSVAWTSNGGGAYVPAFGPVGNMNNGNAGDAGVGGMVGTDSDMPHAFYFLTGSATGYDVTEINCYAGWGDTRVNQAFEIYYLLAGETYGGSGNLPHQLGSAAFSYAPAQPFDGSTKVSLTENSGGLKLLSGITAIEFHFVNNGTATNATSYRELDVIGATSVPEPAAVALLGLGALALLRRRRA